MVTAVAARVTRFGYRSPTGVRGRTDAGLARIDAAPKARNATASAAHPHAPPSPAPGGGDAMNSPAAVVDDDRIANQGEMAPEQELMPGYEALPGEEVGMMECPHQRHE